MNKLHVLLGTVAMFFVACAAAYPQNPALPTGTVRGSVVDAATGKPLPGANIVIVTTDPVTGAAANREGAFVLNRIPLGRHDITVSFVGYRPVRLTGLPVTSGKELVLRVELQEQVFRQETLVVTPGIDKDRPLNDMAFVSARSISVEETRRYAGGLDDPGRMATAFAGVTSTGGVQDNALVIRGNAPKSVQWRLEGVEIPNPNHFAGLSVAGGGGLTLLSGQLLADSDFLTGAFPAQYGNALSGVFDLNFRSGNIGRREHAAQIGLNGIELASEGPFRSSGRSSYLFNYRYSTLALLMPLLPTEGGIRYQDLSFKLSFPGTRAGRFEVWGIGGLDGQELDATRDTTRWEYDFWDRTESEMDLGIGAAGVSHRVRVGEGSLLTSTVAATVNRTRLDQKRLDASVVLQPNLFIDNTGGRLVASSHLDHRPGERHRNRTGFTLNHLFYNLDLRVAPDDVPPLVPYAAGNGTGQLVQAFTQSRFSITPGLTLHAGIHGQWLSIGGQSSVEPRAGIEWNAGKRTTFNLGYGRHSRMEELRIYFLQPETGRPNRALDFAKAHHLVAGYNRGLGEHSRVKLELFYQKLFDVPVIADSSYSMLNFVQDWSFNEPLVNEGEGRNAGLELTVERFLADGYYYLVTGTVYRSRYKDGRNEWHRTRFDQGFAVNALFGKEVTRNNGRHVLGFNGRISYIGGERHSPVDYAASRAAEEVVFNEQNPFTRQFDHRFIADLTLTWRINRGGHSSVWALQVKNLLIEKDRYFDFNLAENRVDLVEKGLPLPILSYKIEF